jgi:serine protease Do
MEYLWPPHYKVDTMRPSSFLPFIGFVLLAADRSPAQDFDLQLRIDRTAFKSSLGWIYDDLATGIGVAKRSHKPLLVVFRCVPCKACQEFDDDVARRDPIIRDLLDEFICVRVPQANNMDLTRFQFDFDLSFAVFFMGSDLTIYGRFGTRSERPEIDDISLEGLRKAMAEALRIHRNRGAFTAALEGKQAKPPRFKTPREYPGIAARFQNAAVDAEITAKSVIYPYPDPSVIGLKLDAKQMATITRVEPGSPADRAGFKPGDEIVELCGQPLLSIADVQWALHNAPDTAKLTAQVRRDRRIAPLTLSLDAGWRRGNISWRTTTWPLREMGFGGIKLENINVEERRRFGLASDHMALKIVYLFEYGDKIAAKRAGLRNGDIIISVDDKNEPMTESELLGDILERKRAGDRLSVTFLRDGTRKSVSYALP